MESPPDLQDAHDDSQDEIQRLLNDAKRSELEKRYGAKFFRPENSRMPPEVEGMFLDHVEEFERQFEVAETIPLRQFVGFPVARAIADLPASAVEDELEALLDRLAEHEVFVDFPDEVEAPEAYKFIVEELLDEEVLDIRIPGMRLHFIYGEFRE
jgi:hypothetical protein